MNCHNNKEGKSNHSPLKHMLHMMLCCGLPIVIVSLLPLITKVSPSAAGIVARIAPFICPIMMISMMVMMMRGSKEKSCCGSKKNNDIENNNSPEL